MTQAQAPPQAMAAPAPQDQYHYPKEDQQWYAGAQYQDPVPVNAPTYATNQLYDQWIGKLEYDDAQATQLPSARVETL